MHTRATHSRIVECEDGHPRVAVALLMPRRDPSGMATILRRRLGKELWGMSLGEIAYEAYHAALSEYRRTHHDHFVQSGGWANVSAKARNPASVEK